MKLIDMLNSKKSQKLTLLEEQALHNFEMGHVYSNPYHTAFVKEADTPLKFKVGDYIIQKTSTGGSGGYVISKHPSLGYRLADQWGGTDKKYFKEKGFKKDAAKSKKVQSFPKVMALIKSKELTTTNKLGESITEGKYDSILDKIAGIVKNSKSFMSIGAELKKNGIKYDFMTADAPMPAAMYTLKNPKIVILNKKYVSGAEREVGDIAIGLMESINEDASHEAQGISHYTGMRATAVQKFIDDNKLNARKLLSYVTRNTDGARTKVITAISGKPNNPMAKKVMKVFKESINEDAKKVWKDGNNLYVDSDFVNMSKGNLPNSELKHLGMGDFFLDTPDGKINFNRSGDKLPGMSGRSHKMSDSNGGKLIAQLIKKMGAKIVNESKVYNCGTPSLMDLLREQTEYEKFFQSALKKFDVKSPDEIEGDKKKEFFDYVDKNWDAGENETDVDEAKTAKTKKDSKSSKKSKSDYSLDGMFGDVKKQLKGITAIKKESVNEGVKRFYQQDGIGKAKYTISYHDGKSKHNDGGDFYGIRIFKNKKELETFRSELLKKGYRADSGFKKESTNQNIRFESMDLYGTGRLVEFNLNLSDLDFGLSLISGIVGVPLAALLAMHAEDGMKSISALLKKKSKNKASVSESSYNIPSLVSLLSEKKYDIGMGHKGNGVTVWNKSEEVSGDYKTIAHITDSGKITYHDKALPSDVKKTIEAAATKMKN